MTNKILTEINRLLQEKSYILVAVDGRCGAGKTTLASDLLAPLQCNIIHMDDFFLRPEQRTKERLDTPGGNVDYERFLSEVLEPLSENRSFVYRPFSCKDQSFGEPVKVQSNRITIVEGSYSCHPQLWDFFDLHIFVDTDPKTQMERISARGGTAAAKAFEEKWIPLEEAYFKAYSIREKCEINIKSGDNCNVF